MKINQATVTTNKLLTLNLAKAKTYKTSSCFDPIKIKDTEFKLKKALKIIYKYHKSNKKILFIGTPLKLNKQLKYLLFKQTKHIIVPETSWVNGSINNKTETGRALLNLKRTPELIVILNKTSTLTVLEESYKAKIITISLGTNFIKGKSSYKISGNFKFLQNQLLNNFFYSVLLTMFKKLI